ncbi:MAG TPA: ABC transporter ATP-binding protein [Capillimicrobium sp.]|nr:ABC transporter ATP-binding protein [Capillimicrobium sp.]
MISTQLPSPVREERLGASQLEVSIATHAGATEPLVSGVSLSVAAGEAVAVVGESGSGKTMTARSLVGLLPPGVRADGVIHFDGRDLDAADPRNREPIRGRGISLVLQDPHTMLNPLARAGSQIADGLALAHPDWSKARLREDVIARLAEVGIRDASVADRYVFQLSGGMKQRVAIAAALAQDPDVLIADEPTSALDVITQRDILAKLREVQQQRGMGLLLVTHDLRVAFSICDRVAVFYAGRIVECGPARAIDAAPRHPYSLGLLASEPDLERRVRLSGIPGSVPRAADVLDRCGFADRCPWSTERCTAAAPPLDEVAPGHASACARIAEIGAELERRRREPAPPELEVDPRPASTDLVCEVADARKAFAGGGLLRPRRPVVALDGVSLEVRAGECVGLVGASGSGKTTTARCLLGLEQLTSGRAVVTGIDITRPRALSRRERDAWRRGVQAVFQDPYTSLNPARSIGWTLREALTRRHRAQRDVDAEVASLLERVGLPAAYAARRPAALSGGQRQRVAIARALATEPRLLICDEPVSALDVSVQAEILALLRRVQHETGVAYLFITHDLAVLRQIATRAYVMHEGTVVEHGPVEQLLAEPRHAYTRRLIEATPRAEQGWAG